MTAFPMIELVMHRPNRPYTQPALALVFVLPCNVRLIQMASCECVCAPEIVHVCCYVCMLCMHVNQCCILTYT